MGKRKIAHYEQFLLFPQCFQKTCTADTVGQTFCFANWVQNKGSISMLCIAPGAFIRRNTLNVTQMLKFVFGRVENILVKGENAGKHYFLASIFSSPEQIVLK